MTVLIVDDIVINRFILKEMVRKMGHNSFEAENGLIACQIFEQKEINLVFLDIEMPVMNGLETALKIKKMSEFKGEKILVYAITAYHPEVLYEEVDISNFDGIISKPFSEEKIKKIIDSFA